jgi:hypothetical protein
MSPRGCEFGREVALEAGREPRLSRRAFLRSAFVAAPAALVVSRVLAEADPPPEVTGLPERLKARVDLRPRFAWAAGGPEGPRMKNMASCRRITIHHAGNGVNLHEREADVVRDLEGIRGAHLRRRFGDIGYHYAIDRAGRVWEARSLAFIGAHVQGANEQNAGVMLLGNFEKQRPSAPQLAALQAVTEVLRDVFRVSAESVFGHRDLGRTLCPGRYLYAYVGELKKT